MGYLTRQASLIDEMSKIFRTMLSPSSSHPEYGNACTVKKKIHGPIYKAGERKFDFMQHLVHHAFTDAPKNQSEDEKQVTCKEIREAVRIWMQCTGVLTVRVIHVEWDEEEATEA